VKIDDRLLLRQLGGLLTHGASLAELVDATDSKTS